MFERICPDEVTTAAQVSSADDSRARTVKRRPRGKKRRGETRTIGVRTAEDADVCFHHTDTPESLVRHGRPFVRARSLSIYRPSLSRYPSPHSPTFAPLTLVKPTTRQQQPRPLFRRHAPRPVTHTFGRGQRTGSPSATKASRDVYRDALLWDQFLSARPCTAFTWLALPWPALPLPSGLAASGECRLTRARNRAEHERWCVIQGSHISI